MFASTFKAPVFSGEKEVRLVANSVSASEIDFFLRDELLVPFCNLLPPEGQELPIRSIWIGPRKYPDLAERSLRLILDKFGYPKTIEIKDSKIPLRSG